MPRLSARRIIPRRLLTLGVLTIGATLTACLRASAPARGAPVVTMTLDSTVAQGDTVHGEAVATGPGDLLSLNVVVIDTAGGTGTGGVIDGGNSSGAGKLDATFRYRVAHTVVGGYVLFRASAINVFGDTTVVRDSSHVTS